MRNQVWDQFSEERHRLQARVGERIRANMSALVSAEEANGADVLLVAADGRKLAAHACILRQRAPIFFHRYVEPTLDATPRERPPRGTPAAARRLVEVAVGDVDSTGLAFFIRSVYTDEEVRQLGAIPLDDNDEDDTRSNDGDGMAGTDGVADDRPGDRREGGNGGEGPPMPARHGPNAPSTSSQNGARHETPANSSPDSLNAVFINDLQIDMVTRTEQSSRQIPMCPQHSQSPQTSYQPLRPRNLAGVSQRMSQSYPSPDDMPMAPRPLFGDTLTSPIVTAPAIPIGGGTAPTMTSFRELAASSSVAPSRCASTQQLTTPSDEMCGRFPSVSGEPGPVIEQNDAPPYASPSRQRCGSSCANKIFPMFINLNASEISPIAARPAHGHALMSRSYPQHDDGGTRSGADSGTSTIHSASLTSSSTSDAAAVTASTGAADLFGGPAPSIGCAESTTTLSTLRSRTMRARRLSVTSLTSLTSIDLTPSHEGPVPLGDHSAASRLGADLLEMFRSGRDADVVVATDDGIEVAAHRCVLWASCAFFRHQLRQNTDRIELKGFSKASVHFLLSFLYGGLTCFPADEEIDVWEVIALAIHLNLEDLTEVAILHIRTYKCHFFHKPCATCVSAIFDALPQFSALKCLQELYNEALAWQARYFARIWKGRVFTHLSANWQNVCLNALLENVDEENVIDVLLSCEKLQVSLPRMKAQSAAKTISAMVANVAEFCTDYLIGTFDALISSRSYRAYGLGLALNLSFLEEILPSLVHSLSAEVAVRTFISLRDLIVHIQECTATTGNVPQSLRGSSRHLSGSNLSLSSTTCTTTDEWNPRFLHLNRRLFELTDRHLLHYAASVVRCEAWNLLSAQERNRINEAGIFVEMELPRAPPPRFSSLNRSYHGQTSAGDGGLTGRSPRHTSRIGAYKRSASAGVHLINGEAAGGSGGGPVERTRSLERGASALALGGCLVETAEEHDSDHMPSSRHCRGLEKIAELNVGGSGDVDSYSSKISLNANDKVPTARGGSLKTRKETLTQIIQNKTNQTFASPKVREIVAAYGDRHQTETIEIITNELADALKVQKSNLADGEASAMCTTKKSITGEKVETAVKEDEIVLQRQNTHTVMTMQQHRESGIDPVHMGVPQVNTTDASTTTTNEGQFIASSKMSVAQKPRSVVRPMPKNPPLAAVAAMAAPSLALETDISKKRYSKESPKKTAEVKKSDEAIKSTNASKEGTKQQRSALPRLMSTRSAATMPPVTPKHRRKPSSGNEVRPSIPDGENRPKIQSSAMPAKAHYLRSTLSLKARQNSTHTEKTTLRQKEKIKPKA